MNKIILLCWILLSCSILSAQNIEDQPYLLTSKTNTIGLSKLSLIDPYLSPLTYQGNGIEFEHESRRFLSVTNTNVSMQSRLDLEVGYLLNPAQTASMTYLEIKPGWGMQYHFRPMKGLVLLAGGNCDLDFGYKEVIRNINNPGNVDLAINLNLSGAAMYDIPLRKRTLRLQLELETPVIGWMYVPLAGASYYEMFDVGNLSNISHVSSIINRRGIDPKISLDIPFKRSVWQVGFRYRTLKYSANNMVFERNEISLLIGTTFDGIAFGGREKRAPKNFISPN
ncbi:MAG: DUF3316 domain-containing protein [Bacteroidota bacterium]|nr:DUF3316 domain-containing protein [Bacteroidota bacterium]